MDLAAVFIDIYHYEVQEWQIPSEDSHNQLQSRILTFLGKSDPQHLKIVYYAGHGRLTNHGTPAWTSLRNSKKERCPTVKWSGIQNTLEESRSDVLILLDCCASGVCTTDEGNGVTELIAACAYNATANGVGPFSFTHALIAKLRLMAQLPYFNIGYLYNAIFTEVQGWRIEDSQFKKAPIHLVLSQNQSLHRSICLSKKPETSSNGEDSSGPTLSSREPENIPPTNDAPPPKQKSASTETTPLGDNSPFSQDAASTSASSISPLPEYPRLLFSIRLTEDVKPADLSCELFSEWLRQVPVSADAVRVEAGFASDSTLLIVSIPVSMMAYLPKDSAITLLGTSRSANLMAMCTVNISSISAPSRRQRSFNYVPYEKDYEEDIRKLRTSLARSPATSMGSKMVYPSETRRSSGRRNSELKEGKRQGANPPKDIVQKTRPSLRRSPAIAGSVADKFRATSSRTSRKTPHSFTSPNDQKPAVFSANFRSGSENEDTEEDIFPDSDGESHDSAREPKKDSGIYMGISDFDFEAAVEAERMSDFKRQMQ